MTLVNVGLQRSSVARKDQWTTFLFCIVTIYLYPAFSNVRGHVSYLCATRMMIICSDFLVKSYIEKLHVAS